MPASAARVASRRAGRNLVALFAATVVFPGLLLAVVGIRTLWQERQIAQRQLRDRLDHAADVAVHDLDREIREWQSALDATARDGFRLDRMPGVIRTALDDPGYAVVLDAADLGRAWPVTQLLYEPVMMPHLPPPTADPALRAAEAAEVQTGRAGEALTLFERASLRKATEAEALAGVARNARKQGRTTQAMAAYRRLATLDARVGVLPADLLARHEICALLSEARQSAELQKSARDLYADLVGGRWRLDRVRFLYYASSVRSYLAGSATETASAIALEGRKRALTEAATAWLDAGGRPQGAALGSFAAVRGRADASPTLLISQDWLAEHLWPRLFAAATTDGVAVTLSGFGGRILFDGRSSTKSPGGVDEAVASRAPEDTQLVSRLAVMPTDVGVFQAEASRRVRLYLVLLLFVLALLGSGTYLTLRVVKQEVAFARLQSDFVSTVSHEFRSPLTGIRQLAELLARGRVPSAERRQEYYERITRESDRLTRLVDNVLDFARLEDGRKTFHFEPLETGPWLASVVEEARAMRTDGPGISTRIAGDLPRVLADDDALRSAVHNLLDNAAKYSPGRDTVWVDADARDGGVAISVKDQGVGIAEEDRRHIFDRFYRASSDITREVKGAGLGLSLVAQIVQAHGGTVQCESRPGEGSTFTIHLRACPASVEEAAL